MFGRCNNNYKAKTDYGKDMEAQNSSGCTSTIKEVSVVAGEGRVRQVKVYSFFQNKRNTDRSNIDMGKKKRSRIHGFYSIACMIITCMSRKETIVIITALFTLIFIDFTNMKSVYFKWSNGGMDRRQADTIRSKYLQHIPYTYSSTYYTSTNSKEVLKFVQENYPDLNSDKEKGKKKFAILRQFCPFISGPFPFFFDIWDEFPPCDLYSDKKMISVDLFLSFSQTYSNNEEAIESVDFIIQNFYSGEYPWSKCFQNIYAVETNIEEEKDNFIPPMSEYLADWINGPNRQFERLFRLIQSKKWGDYESFYLMEMDSIPIRANWLSALLDDMETKRPFAILGSNFEIGIPKWGDFNRDYKSTDQIEPFRKYRASENVLYNTSHPLLDAFVGHLEVEAHSPYNSVPFCYRLIQLLREGKYGEVTQVPPAILLDDEGKNITLSNNTAMLRRWIHTYSSETKDESLEPFKQTNVLADYNVHNTSPERLGDEYICNALKMYNSWRTHRQNITLVISNTNSTRTQEILSDLDRLQHPFTDIIVRGIKADLEHFKMPSTDQVIKHAQPIKFQERRSYHYMDPKLMDICDVKIENSSDWFMIMDSSHNIRENADVLMLNATVRSGYYYKRYYKMLRNKKKLKKKSSVWQNIFGKKKHHNHGHKIQNDMQKDWKPIVPFIPATYTNCMFDEDCNIRLEQGKRFKEDAMKVFYEWDVPFHVQSRNEFCEAWWQMHYPAHEKLYLNKFKFKSLEKFLASQGIEASKALDFTGPRGPTATEYMSYLMRERKHNIYRLTDLTVYMHTSPFVKARSD